MRDAIFLFDPESIRQVYVVPNFISEGYFTQTVVPRELDLNGRITKRSNGQIWKYCEPVGNHAMMTELLLRRAREIRGSAERLHGRAATGVRLAEVDQNFERSRGSVFYL